MIGPRLDDEDKEKNANDTRNAPDVVEKALFDARVVMLTGEINDGVARRVTERLFALASQNANPITFVISSPGGHVESGDMIHDVIKFINAPVQRSGAGRKALGQACQTQMAVGLQPGHVFEHGTA